MITKEIYSPNSFLKLLNKNSIDCSFDKCVLFKDYITYVFELKNDEKLTEFQLYSTTFSVIVESESSCYFIGKKDKKLVFLMTFTNDLKKFGLSKTPETLGKIPKEQMDFDFVKMPLNQMIWYKFDTKGLSSMKEVKEYGEDIQSAEEKILLDEFWEKVSK